MRYAGIITLIMLYLVACNKSEDRQNTPPSITIIKPVENQDFINAEAISIDIDLLDDEALLDITCSLKFLEEISNNQSEEAVIKSLLNPFEPMDHVAPIMGKNVELRNHELWKLPAVYRHGGYKLIIVAKDSDHETTETSVTITL